MGIKSVTAITRTVIVCTECNKENGTGHHPGCSNAHGDETIDVKATDVRHSTNKKPVFHPLPKSLSKISPEILDKVTRQTMKNIGDKILNEILFGTKDNPHPTEEEVNAVETNNRKFQGLKKIVDSNRGS